MGLYSQAPRHPDLVRPPITTGPLEGINNKVKVLERVAYGYRDTEFFGLRLLFLHEVQFKHIGA